MKALHYLLVLVSIFTGLVGGASVASAACPRIEVVFARGTDDSPGAGSVGDAFVGALSARVGGVSVYGVDYPASMDFHSSVAAGVTDAANHIEGTVRSCPSTRIVLGGYSQGAAVAGFVTSAAIPDGAPEGIREPMQGYISGHIRAVILFGTPSPNFLGMVGAPPLAIGPAYAGKTLQLCADGDPVCGSGGNWAAHSTYGDNTTAAANYAASRL